MNEKVKVSREVAEEIERIRTLYQDDKEYLILSAATGFLSRNYKTLKHLKGHEVAEIFISGYEIKETPEEKLLKKFKIASEWTEASTNEPYFRGYQKGVRDSILGTLDILGIKIKGIND